MKKILVLALTVLTLCALTVSASAYGVRVPILLYHNIAESYDPGGSLLHITPQRFQEHMQALKDAGYTTISFQEYYEYLHDQRALPLKSIIVSFDDGYYSNYQFAYPVLKGLGMKGTIFIVTSTVGQTPGVYPHFTWEQAKEMSDSGVIEIGTHTHNHDSLSEMSLAQIRKEIRLSKYLIEKNLGKSCDFIAYPFGFWQEEVYTTAMEAGFKLQCKVGDVGHNTKANPNEPLKRLTVDGQTTPDGLLEQINLNLAQ